MTNGSDEILRLQEEIRSLTEHVTALERRVTTLEAATLEAARPTTPLPVATENERIESRLGMLWVNRIGAITLAFGVLFLFKYAIDKQWITIWGRIVLGLLAGAVLTGSSEWLRKRDQWVFSQGVYGCGVAVFYISLYFGFDQIQNQHASRAVAVCVMSAVFGMLLFLAIRWNRNLLLSFNAAWAILTAGAILHHPYPNSFASFALGVAVVHFVLSSRPHVRPPLRRTLYVLGHGCLLIAALQWVLTWVSRHVAGPDHWNALSESVSVLLGVYAITMIAIGFARRRALDRLLGLFALGVVVLKLYVYDICLLDRLYRITAFVVLGILLLAASYLYSRWKEKLDVLLTDR